MRLSNAGGNGSIRTIPEALVMVINASSMEISVAFKRQAFSWMNSPLRNHFKRQLELRMVTGPNNTTHFVCCKVCFWSNGINGHVVKLAMD